MKGKFSRVRVKRCGKSAPVLRVTGEAWQTPPGARPNRGALEGGPSELPGRSQEVAGNRHPKMNDRYPVRGNFDRAQNSAYGRL